jgi:hypothetical protein
MKKSSLKTVIGEYANGTKVVLGICVMILLSACSGGVHGSIGSDQKPQGAQIVDSTLPGDVAAQP